MWETWCPPLINILPELRCIPIGRSPVGNNACTGNVSRVCTGTSACTRDSPPTASIGSPAGIPAEPVVRALCSACGSPVGPDEKHCGICGSPAGEHPLPTQPAPGISVPAPDSICASCGSPLFPKREDFVVYAERAPIVLLRPPSYPLLSSSMHLLLNKPRNLPGSGCAGRAETRSTPVISSVINVLQNWWMIP